MPIFKFRTLENKRLREQEIFLDIARSWNINKKPEYRGFRCANCQKHLHKAWHHWLTIGDYSGWQANITERSTHYKTPIHFCDDCEGTLRAFNIKEVKVPSTINKKNIRFKNYSRANARLRKIIDRWNIKNRPVFKIFTCDNCGRNIRRAYHCWFRIDATLVETHFCKSCGNKLKFND